MSRALTASPSSISEVIQREFQLRKFDLVLHHIDGAEYDGTGCLSCIPSCRKPLYPAGEHITGYLLIRPMRKLVINGVSVTFSGQFVTNWEDSNIQWGSHQTFYRENVEVIRDRRIALDNKWYRFDFEYILPRALPSSFKDPNAKLIYYATGAVSQPHDLDIETMDTHFHVKGVVDIDLFPAAVHLAAEAEHVFMFPPNNSISYQQDSLPNGNSAFDQLPTSHDCSCEVLTNHNTEETEGDLSQTDEVNVGGSNGAISQSQDIRPSSPHVYALMWINTQAYVIGQQIVVDLKIENSTAGAIECTLRLEQDVFLHATIGKEKRHKREPPIVHFRKQKHVISKIMETYWIFRLEQHSKEAYSKVFYIPTVSPSMLANYTHLPYPESGHHTGATGQEDPSAKNEYLLSLSIQPEIPCVNPSRLRIPIFIGNKDSEVRRQEHIANSQFEEETELWDSPDQHEGPPSYEEFFGTSEAIPLSTDIHNSSTRSLNFDLRTQNTTGFYNTKPYSRSLNFNDTRLRSMGVFSGNEDSHRSPEYDATSALLQDETVEDSMENLQIVSSC